MVRGARQVGKSTLVRLFADAHFENLVALDFEQDRAVARAFEAPSPGKTVALLESIQQASILDAKTYTSTKQSKNYRLLSLPFYLVGQAQRLCRAARGDL